MPKHGGKDYPENIYRRLITHPGYCVFLCGNRHGNIPFAATENDLINFLKLPIQTEVEIPVFRHNPSRKIGFAFVTVDVALVEEVLKFNDEEMMGRKLKVALGKPKDQSKPDKWQKKPEMAGELAGVVMQSRPRRGIPQSELTKLQKLRDSLGKMKVSDDDGSGVVKEVTAKPVIDVGRLQMVDVGANLTNFRYRENVEQVISRALSSGVHKMIITSSTLEDAQKALILAETLPGVLYCTVGVHPHEAKQWTPESGALLRSLLDHPQVIAIGVCGLDYFRMLSSFDKQWEAFEDQIVIACQTRKPLFVHNRDSNKDLTDKLLSHKASLPPTLIHCFTGTHKQADFYIQRGFYIGITGFVSKPDEGAELRSILKDKVIPLDRLVIETNCPFLMPNIPKDGFQGVDFTDIKQGRNEPCTLVLVADTVAKCYGVSLEEVVETTTRNAIQLFNL